MNYKRNFSMAGFIITAVMSCLIVISGFLSNVVQSKDRMDGTTRSFAYEISAQSVNLVHSQINRDLERLTTMATFIGKSENLSMEDIRNILLEENKHTPFKRMGFILPNGEGCSTDDIHMNGANLSERDYFISAMKGLPFVSKMLEDRITEGQIFVYAVPVYQDNKIVGVLFAAQKREVYNKLLSISTFGGGGFTGICESTGELVIESNEAMFEKVQNLSELDKVAVIENGYTIGAMLSKMKSGESGVIEFSIDNQKITMSYSPIGENNWYLLSFIPSNVISDETMRGNTGAILLITLIMLLLGGMMLYIVRKQEESRKTLYKMALEDTVTGTDNFNNFIYKAREKIKNKNGQRLALIALDIKKFRFVNSTFGFNEGNGVLTQIARILSRATEKDAFFARMANDNFLILTETPSDKSYITQLCADIRERIGYIATEKNVDLSLVPSIGVYFIEQNETDIFACIDKAMFVRSIIKDNPNESLAIYDEELWKRMTIEKELEADMADALKGGQFEVYLQPKVALSSGKVSGSEALIRWNHWKKGMLSPGSFVPLFEKNGFIINIDTYVFREVCKTIKSWQKENLKVLPVSVNVSRINLRNPDFIEEFSQITEDYGVSPELIELEITESAFVDEKGLLISIINRIKKAGFKLSMDDFGSGFSSLNLLREMPIDVLKLDRGFLDPSANSKKDCIVVESVVKMAKNLDISVVSEGIETQQQAEFLNSIGCDIGQGYFFAKPMPIKDFEKMVYGTDIR